MVDVRGDVLRPPHGSLCTHIRPVLVKNMLILASYVKQMDIYLRKVYIGRKVTSALGERGGSMVECRTPEREVGGSIPTAAVLCP